MRGEAAVPVATASVNTSEEAEHPADLRTPSVQAEWPPDCEAHVCTHICLDRLYEEKKHVYTTLKSVIKVYLELALYI